MRATPFDHHDTPARTHCRLAEYATADRIRAAPARGASHPTREGARHEREGNFVDDRLRVHRGGLRWRRRWRGFEPAARATGVLRISAAICPGPTHHPAGPYRHRAGYHVQRGP